MRLVIIESPYAPSNGHTVEHNLKYLRAAMHDCLMRGEAPYASHALYTQPGVLDDTKPDKRKHGIEAGFAWRCVADVTIVYADLGITNGMKLGIAAAQERVDRLVRLGEKWHDIEIRFLGAPWSYHAPFDAPWSGEPHPEL